MVRQNKWRAARFGGRAQLVDSYTYEVLPVVAVVTRLVSRLRPVAQELGCERHLEHCIHMAEGPNAAERQLNILNSGAPPEEIVRQMTEASRV